MHFVFMTYIHRPARTYRAALLSLTGCLAVLGLALSSCSPTTDVSSSGSTELAADAPYEARLANHLTAQEATMYGAFWCPHCQDQKALFGDAADQVPYVECDPEGENAQPELCQTKDIQGYPTWEIDGELYPGTRSLEELAQLSGFEAP
jgi:glutaredoxin